MSKNGRIKQMFTKNKTRVSPGPRDHRPSAASKMTYSGDKKYTSLQIISINSLKPDEVIEKLNPKGRSTAGTIRYNITHLRVFQGCSDKDFDSNGSLVVSTPLCSKSKLDRS
jgi:hypothetical protein